MAGKNFKNALAVNKMNYVQTHVPTWRTFALSIWPISKDSFFEVKMCVTLISQRKDGVELGRKKNGVQPIDKINNWIKQATWREEMGSVVWPQDPLCLGVLNIVFL